MSVRTLWVKGSPKGEESLSSTLAKEFIAAADPSAIGTVERLDVWSDDFPRVDQDAALAKFALLLGDPVTDEQRNKWQRIAAEIERVREFDRIVVSSPMWNWSLPYPLKAWIDTLAQPVLSFTLDSQGRHIGALGEGRPLHLVLTRSSAYDGRHPELRDFQLPYLKYLFTMLGYDVDALVFEPTTQWEPEQRITYTREALAIARERGAELSAMTQEST